MPIVVFELVPMVFVHIEVLIFDLPARAPNAHDSGHIVRPDLEVREPGIVVELRTRAVVLPDLYQRPPQTPRRRQGHRAGNTVRIKAPSTRWPFIPLALVTAVQPL